MLRTNPAETIMRVGIGAMLGLFVGGWVADRQRPT